MGTLFGSPRKVLVVATVLVVAIVLVALFGSKKLPDNVPAWPPRTGLVPPRAPGPGAEEDPVDHQPVIIPPVPCRRCAGSSGSSRAQVAISQVMPLQPVIHRTIKAETADQDLQDTP